MPMAAVLKRFVDKAPVAVMARLGLQRAIGPDWVNEVFEQHSKTQYTRELLFSTVVDLMSLVALGAPVPARCRTEDALQPARLDHGAL